MLKNSWQLLWRSYNQWKLMVAKRQQISKYALKVNMTSFFMFLFHFFTSSSFLAGYRFIIFTQPLRSGWIWQKVNF